jgi:hypothetical protein
MVYANLKEEICLRQVRRSLQPSHHHQHRPQQPNLSLTAGNCCYLFSTKGFVKYLGPSTLSVFLTSTKNTGALTSMNMEEDPGNNPRSVFTSKETANRNQLQPKRYSIIQKSFQKPVATSLEQLRKWHEEYKAAKDQFSSQHAIVQEVQTDELDEEAIETCIAALAKEIPVTNGFCGDCQHLFHNWPDLGDPNVKDPKTKINWPGSGADWKHTVAQECHTLVLEAAARNGCKFCAFLMQMLRDAELLQTFRRLEMRLGYLEDTAMATLSLQNWGMNTSQLLWINLPGKVCNHCNSAMAQETGFESAALESSGK